MNEELVKEALQRLKNPCLVHTQVEEIRDLLNQALTPEQTFYYDQPVLVSDDKVTWSSGLFKELTPKLTFLFTVSCYISEDCEDHSRWKYCKPDPAAESLPNWRVREENKVLWAYEGGQVVLSKDKKFYCIIKDPKFENKP